MEQNKCKYDIELTEKCRAYAMELGADLVGFGNIERYKNAPIMMSPQGILPTSKSIIVCAIHHPDATIELDGEPSAHKQDSYGVQMTMNHKFDMISFRFARMLEGLGYKTIPIAGSNIWRYKEYKGLKAVFAPDISHIYSSVAAGLTVMGWNGLALSPEYGARNRFVTVITEAPLVPTPLLDEKVCDMCGECIETCPMDCFKKELLGMNQLEIEDKIHKFPKRNLWRCAWSEHFALDLDKEIPDVVNEQVILDTMKRDGRRSGTLGTCLKVCVPANMREKKPEYTKHYHRKNQFLPTGLPLPRKYLEKAKVIAKKFDIDKIYIISKQEAIKKGVDITLALPDAQSIIVLESWYNTSGCKEKSREVGKTNSQIFKFANDYRTRFAAIDITRMLDSLGISVITHSKIISDQYDSLVDAPVEGYEYMYQNIVLNHKLDDNEYQLSGFINLLSNKEKRIKSLAKEFGADLVGIADAKTISDVVDQLKEIHANEYILDATDKNGFFLPYDPEIKQRKRNFMTPGDYLDGAQSVIMVGASYPKTAAIRAGLPPAESVGPYVMSRYQVEREQSFTAISLAKAIQKMGYKAVVTADLTKLGTQTASPRGMINSPINNSIEAVCAGLGRLTYNGCVDTDEYGICQSFAAVITDMPLKSDKVLSPENNVCKDCEKCISACPVSALAIDDMKILDIAGQKYEYVPLDLPRCDWTVRYALTNRDGFIYNGAKIDEMPPEDIDIESLEKALKKSDPINKFRPTTTHHCVIKCPLIDKE